MPSRFLPSLAAAAVLTGCAVGQTTMDRDPPDLRSLGEDAILVLKLQPEYRVHIISGTKTTDGWASDETPMSSAVVVNTFPKREYIVARVKGTRSNQVYGLSAVLPAGIGVAVPHFKACTGDLTPTFEVPPGQVTYVGSVLVTGKGDVVQPGPSEDLSRVRAQLSVDFPAASSAMEFRPLKMTRLSKALCASPKIVVPVPTVR
ncbi:MAG: hypothetical protein JNK28_05650 [Burkholderiaceae bacterium]|nr:hypothetical protein [Burkholderiaceae bacterium]